MYGTGTPYKDSLMKNVGRWQREGCGLSASSLEKVVISLIWD